MSFLDDLQKKPSRLVMGLMSGTSADGVDAALVQITGHGKELRQELLHFEIHAYPPYVRKEIMDLSNGDGCDARRLAELDARLGHEFALAAEKCLQGVRMPAERLDLVGSHGQTLCHRPPRPKGTYFAPESILMDLGASLQIGDPAYIAERLQKPVVSHFRQRDIAAGGQGAPLVPYVDQLLLRSPSASRVAVNIGGITNLTFLPPAGSDEPVTAFDVGPGNMVMDTLASMATVGELEYDRDGELAARGKADLFFLNQLGAHEFYTKSPPKSAGREEFGRDYAQEIWNRGVARGIAPSNLMATVTRLTAMVLVHALDHHLRSKQPIKEAIFSGGGVKNPVLMEHIKQMLQGRCVVVTSDALGLPAKAKEAIAFAILANELVFNQPTNLPQATGAAGLRVLGRITPP
ncbi:MAG: anhydro-N-acetylmuramic acid kinase [Planctomycetota bacterium]